MKRSSKISILVSGIVLALLLSFQACESVLFIELEEGVKLIVVNGAVSEADSVAVQVSRTRHILDNAPVVALENADVRLLENGNEVGKLNYEGNGYYVLRNFKPSIGPEYTIEASSEGYPSVRATSYIPSAVPITRLDTSIREEERSGDGYYYYGGLFLQFDLGLVDPEGEDNYYLLSVYSDRSTAEYRGDTTVTIVDSVFWGGEWYPDFRDSIYPLYDTFRYQQFAGIISEDIIVEAFAPEGLVFSDQLIDGEAYTVRGELQSYYISSADSANLEFQLKSISEDYYKYLKSRSEHYITKEDYLAVPVIVYTNVEDGTGFLGGFSSDQRTITTFVHEDYWGYYEYW